MEGHADLALVERCRANVPGAFEELYRAHAPRLFGLACRMVGRAEAEDLLQEIFLTAHRKLGLYKGESALGTWLFRLATNQCLDHLRSKRARFMQLTETFDDEPGATGPSAGAILGVVDRLDLERALAALPAGCRTVFVLHDVEGCEHQRDWRSCSASRTARRNRSCTRRACGCAACWRREPRATGSAS